MPETNPNSTTYGLRREDFERVATGDISPEIIKLYRGNPVALNFIESMLHDSEYMRHTRESKRLSKEGNTGVANALINWLTQRTFRE